MTREERQERRAEIQYRLEYGKVLDSDCEWLLDEVARLEDLEEKYRNFVATIDEDFSKGARFLDFARFGPWAADLLRSRR
jgi:hypothetical protein